MRELVLTPKFKRSFRKFVRRNPRLQRKIEETLEKMQSDVFSIQLDTHKLEGELRGLLACSCGYDCRIVFSVERDQKTGKEVVILISIGTHNEVY
jgi:addiction module RelE/StbE family toxin